MIRSLLLPVCMVIYCQSVFSQGNLSGVVTDASSGETLPGVTVYTNQSQTGTSTGVDGRYQLSYTAADDTVIFSFIGFETKRMAIAGRTQLDVALQPDFESLEEVVVVAYGTQRKSDLTGSVSMVQAEEMTKIPASNPIQALQGKVAGLQVGAVSGEPGTSPVVRLRGVGTFNDASVLYVVDGVFTNDVNFLSPNDIESVSVLKDASATALYGSRGANGVIIITTKKGKMGADGKPIINFSAEYGHQYLAKKIDLLEGREFAEVLNEITPGSFNNLDRVPNTDWQDLIFRDFAPIQNYNLSLSGASEKSDYYFGLGYFKQEGIVPKSAFERATIRLNNTFKPYEALRLGVNFNVTPSRNEGSPGVIANAYRAWPTEVPFTDEGAFAEVLGGGNPLAAIEFTNSETHSVQSLGNGFMEVDFFRDFTARTSFGYDLSYFESTNFTPVYFVSAAQSNDINDLTKARSKNFTWLWENTLDYAKEIGKHRVDALLGYTAQKTRNEGLGISIDDLIDEDPNMRYLVAGDRTTLVLSGDGANIAALETLASLLFRTNYVYDNRYLLTFNYRRDGSSKFGPNNRYGDFFSAAVGWNIMNEAWMPEVSSYLDDLKLRASYGQVGNEKIPGSRQFTLVSNGQQAVFGAGEVLVPGASYGVIGNPDLRWETTTTANIGLDFAFLKNRLSGTIEWYNRVTSDILVDLISPGHLGNGAFQTTTANAAEVRNRGWEFNVAWQNDTRYGLYYRVGVLGSTVENEVLKMGRLTGANSFIAAGSLGNGQLVTRTEVGTSIAPFYGYRAIGVIQTEEELSTLPILAGQQVGDLRYEDINGDGVIDQADQTVIGSYIPDFIYGFNLSVGYKILSLELDFYGQVGNEIYNGKDVVRPDQYNYEAYMANYWDGPGTSTTVPRPTSGGINYSVSDFFVQDASFFRLRSATIAVNMPEKWTRSLQISQARFYIRGTNVFTLSDFTGYSPEINSTNLLSSGIDLGTYPITSVYTLGLNFSF